MSIRQLFASSTAWAFTVVGLLGFCDLAHPTTVISLINRSGIVLVSDSKTTVPGGNEVSATMLCHGGEVQKIAIIQERWGIAASDSTCFSYSDGKKVEVAFDFIPWIHDLEGNLPKDISFDQFVGRVRDKFAVLVPKIEIFIANGQWGKPQDPGENFERLITFSVTGYDKGIPRLTIIKFYIDWSIKTVPDAYVIPIDLGPIKSSTHFYYAGISESVANFFDGNSYAHKQAMAVDRETFTNFFSHRLPTLNESVAIGRALVKIEEEIRPDVVGGAIRGVKITPDGRATEAADPTLSKTRTRKQNKGAKQQ